MKFNRAISCNPFVLGRLCDKDLNGFGNWSFNVDVKDKQILVHTGEKELEGIGKRYRTRLPTLLNVYSKDQFKVRALE